MSFVLECDLFLNFILCQKVDKIDSGEIPARTVK